LRQVMDDEDVNVLIRPLQLNDLPFMIALEQSSFPPNEAATPEKVPPRLPLPHPETHFPA
jgi:hypothetical protein